MINNSQVTLVKCDDCGKYYEACNIHKCKKKPQHDKYIPCTHCTVQQCNNCDYKIHQKAMTMIRAHKDNLISLRNHFKSYTDDDVFKQDFETVTDVLEGLDMLE